MAVNIYLSIKYVMETKMVIKYEISYEANIGSQGNILHHYDSKVHRLKHLDDELEVNNSNFVFAKTSYL